MNFCSLSAWGIFFALLIEIILLKGVYKVFELATRGKYKNCNFDKLLLVQMSFILLGYVSWQTVVCLSIVLLVTYWGTELVKQSFFEGKRKWGLGFLIVLQLVPLFYYKYFSFCCSVVTGEAFDMWKDAIVPLGISYYTFMMISYSVDGVKKSLPKPSFVNFINFASFFPQIAAGPIGRRNELIPQFERFSFSWSVKNIDTGVRYFALGLFFKMVMANNLALLSPTKLVTNVYDVWFDNVNFGLQLYFDFAGYSFMAIGVGKTLGIDLMLNFNAPYLSRNLADFWRRWHISLMNWLRDYIYFPLGGSRCNHTLLNLMIVFTVSGIWHGAGWNFVLWGGLNGILLVVSKFFKWTLPTLIAWFITCLAAFFTWMSFYEVDISRLWDKIVLIITPCSYGLEKMIAFANPVLNKHLNPFLTFPLYAMIVVVIGLEALSQHKTGKAYSYFLSTPGVIVMGILTIFLTPGSIEDFIYFAM